MTVLRLAPAMLLFVRAATDKHPASVIVVVVTKALCCLLSGISTERARYNRKPISTLV